MAMIAWHGSRYGECFFMRGHEKDVAWFSFYRDVAEEFAKLAWTEDERLPTLCKVQINGDRGQLFDAYDLYDDEFRERFTACLKAKGVDDQWLDSIIGSMQHYDFIAFDPDGGGTDSDKVAACVKELGYIGWLEREHHADDPENFGLFDPGLRVTVIEELKLCPDCMRNMEKVSEHEYECDSCESTYRICGDCGQAMDLDDEDEEWIHACDCDVRQNPSDSCKDTYRDLKDALSPDLHSARYNLSVAVGEAVDDCAKDRSWHLRAMTAQEIKKLTSALDMEDSLPSSPDVLTFGHALQERIEFDCEDMDEVISVADVLRVSPLFRHFIPPFAGYEDVKEITTPFWFVHFTTTPAAHAIESEGFVGNEDVETLYSTKYGRSSETSSVGYVFAYLLNASNEVDARYEVYRKFKDYIDSYEAIEYDEQQYIEDPYPYKCVVGPQYVVARAEYGVEAFHKMDEERQLIVPIACIDASSVTAVFDVLEDFGVEDYD